ncbi:MAG: Rieske (2Fe-2S) protein [Pseudonocardiales bacterium]|nr:Rieske (2Fe-2S) protein [Pseudonocardiales bacterium]
MTIAERIERARGLDRVAGAARDAVQGVLRTGAVKDALHGVWLGHALHPALAQFTLGSFVSASLLDAVGGRTRESSTLVAAGLAATLPTVASGWADYADGHEEQQRVGVVHAALNGAGVALYAGALLARSRGGRGRALTAAGGALVSLSAYLGGHMAFRQALGPNHAEAVPHTGPEDWQPLGPLAEVPDRRPVRRLAGDTPVVVVRTADAVAVLADRCPHASAPLHEGELGEQDGCATLTCPWHGSVFRTADGGVVHGPATAPVPRFETRAVDGVLEARVVTHPGVPAS